MVLTTMSSPGENNQSIESKNRQVMNLLKPPPSPNLSSCSLTSSSSTSESISITDKASIVSEPPAQITHLMVDPGTSERCRSKSFGGATKHNHAITTSIVSSPLQLSQTYLLRCDCGTLFHGPNFYHLQAPEENVDKNVRGDEEDAPAWKNRKKNKITCPRPSPVIRRHSRIANNTRFYDGCWKEMRMLVPNPNDPNSMGVTSNGHFPLNDTYDAISLDPSNTNSNIYTIPVCNTDSIKDGGGQLIHQLDDKSSSTIDIYSSSTPNPTSDFDKKEGFRKCISVVTSAIYAIFLVITAVVIYVIDLLKDCSHVVEAFNIVLTTIGLSWLIFLHIDIRRHANRRCKWKWPRDGNDSANPENRSANARDYDSRRKTSNIRSCIETHYYFRTGRHSGSFYLKIGAAAFCFGHLIHEGLLLSRPISYLTENHKDCFKIPTLILDVMHPVLSFYQLYFIFKYSNVVINRFRELARFALMHIIATNLSFWIHTIFRETVESMQHKMDSNDTIKFPPFLDIINRTKQRESGLCVSEMGLSNFTLAANPYLYPFTIEYSLLLVGVWFIIWYNIGNAEWNEDSARTQRDSSSVKSVDDFTSNLVIHVDCHSANRGLFAGLLVFLVTVISVIIFFVSMMNREYVSTGMLINNISDLVLVVLMTVCVGIAYRQICKLDINPHAVTFLDATLLFVALPCFFLYGIFNVMAGILAGNGFSIASGVLSVVQISLQTPFIMDGLRRCSNTQVLRYQKPGRELITFLVVCNLAMWVLETFEIKSTDAHYDKVQVFGKFMWTCMSHVTLPLTLFYRFHSSVCLVDIWKSAYEVGEA